MHRQTSSNFFFSRNEDGGIGGGDAGGADADAATGAHTSKAGSLKLPAAAAAGALNSLDSSRGHPDNNNYYADANGAGGGNEGRVRGSIDGASHVHVHQQQQESLLQQQQLQLDPQPFQPQRPIVLTACDECDDDVDVAPTPALHFCLTCARPLCDFHRANHQRSKATKQHPLIALSTPNHRGGALNASGGGGLNSNTADADADGALLSSVAAAAWLLLGGGGGGGLGGNAGSDATQHHQAGNGLVGAPADASSAALSSAASAHSLIAMCDRELASAAAALKPAQCGAHADEPLVLFCQRCQVPVCRMCVLPGGHATHPMHTVCGRRRGIYFQKTPQCLIF